MFTQSEVVRVGTATVTTENGCILVQTERGLIKVVLEIDLKKITKYRVKGYLNTEKFAYGIVNPVLTTQERTDLRSTINLVYNNVMDKIINVLVLNQTADTPTLENAVRIAFGHRVLVSNRQLEIAI